MPDPNSCFEDKFFFIRGKDFKPYTHSQGNLFSKHKFFKAKFCVGEKSHFLGLLE